MGFLMNEEVEEKTGEKWKCSKEEMRSFLLSNDSQRHEALDQERKLPDDKPEWYDEELLKSGQQFSQKFFMPICMSQIVGLLTLLSFKNSIKPLVYTRKSDSLYTAKERYLSTVLIVNSWYESDLWDKNSQGNKNLQKVRNYHLSVSKKINSLSDAELNNKCSLSSTIGRENIKCHLFEKVAKDLKGLGGEEIRRYNHRTVYFNQAEMSLTLFGFMGLVVACPEKFGVPDNEEGLAGFVHLWRVVGYMLGVRDENNFCKGSLADVKENCIKLIKYVFRPNMENINDEWEHMSRCAVDGLKMELGGYQFEVIFLCLLWVYDLDLTNILKNVSWVCRIKFYMYKFVIAYLYKFHLIKSAINFSLKTTLRHALKKRNKNV
ncbi:uncharacterized protein LOC106673647 isoform X2 [Cimex lectularius]|nr:uncharacterized protein LOC106673647 isoform X2 [Cimex lectularius]